MGRHLVLAGTQRTIFTLGVVVGTSACVSTRPAHTAVFAEDSKLVARAPAATLPGVPNRPDLVTVVPFYWKPDETDVEKTKVVIPAEVDGYHSIFIVDIGCPPLLLNRTFLQPSPTGGLDTVTDAHRLPDHTVEDDPATFDHVTVRTVRIGTFDIRVTDPVIGSTHNAYLGHMWGNFSWVFSPRLGNLGLSVLSQFETIIDYTHQRLVLIRVDSAGRRLVDVPAYTPRWSAPLLQLDKWGNAWRAWGIAVRSDQSLDTLTEANNTQPLMLDTGAQDNESDILGYPFLSSFGVVGFNYRARRFILYR